MARIRSVKPSLRTSLTVAEWPRDVRYLWVLLWGYLDDYGRGVDDARLVKADCLPLDDDVTRDTVEEWLNMMAKSGPLCRYTVAGRRYMHAPNWPEHQKPSHPKDSEIPPCPFHDLGQPRDDPPESLAKPSGEPRETLRPEMEVEMEVEGEVPPTAEPLRDSRTNEPANAQTIIGEYLDRCRRRPPKAVIGHLSRHVKALLAEGIDPDDVRRGLATWMTKGLHPSTLPSVVNEVMNGVQARASPSNVVALRDTRPSTTDQRVAAGLALAAKYDALESQENP